MRSFQCLFLIVFTEARQFQRNGPPSHESTFIQSHGDEPAVQLPVPFGHIYKDGFGDPYSNLKTPVDMLEWIMKHPKNPQEAKEWLNSADPDNIEFYKSTYPQPKRFLAARDQFISGINDTMPSQNESELKWFDLAEIHSRNVANPPSFRRPNEPNNRLKLAIAPPSGMSDFIMPGRVDPMLIGGHESDKFTTCDEFGSKAYFYPKDIVNFNWVPFYIWSSRDYPKANVHTFTYATKKLVNKYRGIYQQNKLIDWSQPKLVMKGMNDFLLIAADRKGLFHALSLVELPDIYPKDFILPYASMRLKIEDPYLLLMLCEDHYATAMAVEGHEPSTDREKQVEADSLEIRGRGYPVSRNIREEQEALRAQRRKEEQMKEASIVREKFNIPHFNDAAESIST